MNIPKKQKKMPKWLPTAVCLLAIITIILLIYIIITLTSESKDKKAQTTPTPCQSSAPVQISDTPLPTQNPDDVYSNYPLSPIASDAPLFTEVSDYLLSTLGEKYVSSTLTLYMRQTPKTDLTLLYARYTCDDTCQVLELISGPIIHPADSDPDLSAFLIKSRAKSDVAAIYIEALISNFYLYRNTENKAALATLLTTGSEDDAQSIIKHMEYLDKITLKSLTINPITSSTVDFSVFCGEEVHLLGISTAAPGLSELLIRLDASYYPLIFIGETDAAADSARELLKSSADYKALKEATEADLKKALESDAALKKAYENMQKK